MIEVQVFAYHKVTMMSCCQSLPLACVFMTATMFDHFGVHSLRNLRVLFVLMMENVHNEIVVWQVAG